MENMCFSNGDVNVYQRVDPAKMDERELEVPRFHVCWIYHDISICSPPNVCLNVLPRCF